VQTLPDGEGGSIIWVGRLHTTHGAGQGESIEPRAVPAVATD